MTVYRLMRKCRRSVTVKLICAVLFTILILPTYPLFAIESEALKRTIRLRGLPDDEVPVVTSLAIQPRGDLLATSGDDHAVRLWDLETGELQRTLRGHHDWVTSVRFCEDGKKLLTGSRDRKVLKWDLVRRTRPHVLGEHSGPITTIRVHEESGLAAVVGFRTKLQLFDFKNARLVRTLGCPCLDTRAVAFSDSGEWLAAGGRNGKIRVWSLRTGDHFDLLGHERRITSVVFADDGVLLSAGEDQLIHCWDVQSGRRNHSFLQKSGKVMAMVMVGEDQFAAATSSNVIGLFDLQDREPFAILSGHTGSVAALAARDQELISGSFDTTIRIWAIRNEEADNQASNDGGRFEKGTVRTAKIRNAAGANSAVFD